MKSKSDCSRRNFMKTAGGGVPTLTFLMQQTSAAPASLATKKHQAVSDKFIPIDLSRQFTAAPADFGSRERAKELSRESREDGLIRLPGGKQVFRGIPFWLGPEDAMKKSWIALSSQTASWMTQSLEMPLNQKAGFICLAQFCDWDPNERPAPGQDVLERVGQVLAEAVLIYGDGSEQSLPIRRRFEVNSPSVDWGHLSFQAVPHRSDVPTKLGDSLNNAQWWGDLQCGVWESDYAADPALDSSVTLWLCALENPWPDRTLTALRIESRDVDPLVICGLTLFQGHENPLRYERLSLYRITLPEPSAADGGRWQVSVDLGVVARTSAGRAFEPETWLAQPRIGLGDDAVFGQPTRHIFAEVTASSEATLWLDDTKTGKRYQFELRKAVPGQELSAHTGGARVEILEPHKVWIHGRVLDIATQRPTPVRLAFRSKEGRYIPPYGHRTEINSAWFQDYGADVQWHDSSFAVIDGAFQIELPVGEVYLEMTKGFEYSGVRRKLMIEPSQRELNLEISPLLNFRSQGWVSADSHVHFLSPSTAILEGQAEGVNLINLLAAQWGDLFTNVGDMPQGPLVSRDGETMVWVGTENRQHILGHLGLLGGHGAPVYPMSASGPGESYIGDPLWNSLSEWADACRKREGLVVAVHFPYPTAELAADIVMDKIDAVEMWPTTMTEHFNSLRFLEWYRYLNCGYRLPAVGGTDKMGAWTPVGANRAYAYIGQDEFNFANWAKAVRKGNTFMTSGPLLLFQTDGKPPGAEISLGTGGGSLEVQTHARSYVPFHRLEVIMNGRVVASREEKAGSHDMTLKETVPVSGSCWLAARCASRVEKAHTMRVAAHSSPVYVRVRGEEQFSPPVAAYLLTLIDGSEAWVKNLATRPDPQRFAGVLKVFSDARERLHRRLHAHGIKH
jgi:hypothetical protein